MKSFTSKKTSSNFIKSIFRALEKTARLFGVIRKNFDKNFVHRLRNREKSQGNIYSQFFKKSAFPVTVICVLAFVSQSLYAATTMYDVGAVYEYQTLNIHPGSVVARGWNNPEQALVQDEHDDSLSVDFDETDSAYIAHEIQVPEEVIQSDEVVGQENLEDSSAEVTPSDVDTTQGSSDEVVEDVSPSGEDVPPVVDEIDPGTNEAPAQEDVSVPEEAPQPEQVSGETALQALSKSFFTFIGRATEHLPFAQESLVEPVVQNEADNANETVVEETISEPEVLIETDAPPQSTQSEVPPGEEIVVEDTTDPAVDEETVPDEQSTALPQSSESEVVSSDTASSSIPCEGATCEIPVIEFADFTVGENFDDQKITNMQLRMSLGGKVHENALPGGYLRIEYEHYDFWMDGGIIPLDEEVSNALNGGYFLFGFPLYSDWDELRRIKVRVSYVGDTEHLPSVYLDSVWLEIESIHNNALIDPRAMPAPEDDVVVDETLWTNAPAEYTVTRESEETEFEKDEIPRFEFDIAKVAVPEEAPSFLRRVGQGVLAFLGFEDEEVVPEEDDFEIEIVDGEFEGIAEVVEDEDGTYAVELPKLREFTPGVHIITLEVRDGDNVFYIEQEFSWGVLALNADKTIFLPDEEAYLQMGVLDDEGHTICDASLSLRILDPNGGETLLSTDAGSINYGRECAGDTYTTSPDYDALYTFASGIGSYVMELTAVTANGSHTITDAFEVRESVPFDVVRSGPTRIYPPEAYPVRITVTANEAYSGPVIELVPISFQILESNTPFRTYEIGDTKQIIWDVDLDVGESVTLTYRFDAPDVSPEFYLLGPLSIGAFNEAREWQIASDAPDNARIVQSVLGTPASATSYSATFGTPPTSGNAIIMVAMHRDGASAFTAPAYLSQAVLSNATVEIDIGIWYGAADPATSTYSIAKTGGNQTGIVYLMEVSGLDMSSTLNATSSNNQTGATGLIAWTGLAPTTTPYGFAVAAVGVGDNDFTDPTTASWTSSSTESYTQRSWVEWATGNDGGFGIATADVRRSAPQQARLTLTTGGVEERNSVIAVFKIQNQVTTVASRGNQNDVLKINTTGNNVGGMFRLTPNTGSTSVTNITITENGTTNAQTDLSDITLRYEFDAIAPYDCASATFDGTETQYGATSSAFSAANGTASFSGSVSVATTSVMCIHTILNIDSTATPGDTLELEISTPTTEVTMDQGSTTPGTAVAISNTSVLQIGYVTGKTLLSATPAFPFLFATSTQPTLGGFAAPDQDNDLLGYEITIDDDPTFASPATTSISQNYVGGGGGWASSTFASGATTTYQVPAGLLTTGETYWWRVRARDPFNRNEWGDYSVSRSFTVGSSITVPEWHQTTDYQFGTSSTLVSATTTGSGSITPINSSSSVALLNAWSLGTTKAVSAGTDRLLVVAIASEDTTGNVNVNEVRYGGQLMTEIYDQQIGVAGSNGLWVGYLNDAGITSATSTSITVAWVGTTPVNGIIYQSAAFQRVSQSNPIRDYSANALTTGTTISPVSSTTVQTGDMSFYAVSSGASRTYTPHTGYTEGTDNNTCAGGCSAASAYKSIAANGTELPLATLSGSTNRVLITDVVLRAAAASGTIMSPEIDFDWVPGQSDWGEVVWNVTENAGNDTRLRVYYSSTTPCDTPVPNGTLSGNTAGFGTTSIPLNISSLSTTTYNRICLQATLSENSGGSPPLLTSWTVRWDRTPIFNQNQYRWYATATSTTPTDTWPLGTSGTQLDQNQPITSTDPIDYGQVTRLRMGVGVTSVAASGRTFKLQYAEGTTCGPTLDWLNVGGTGSTTALWRGYDISGLTDGATIASTTLSSSTVFESYEEENDSATMPNSVAINGQGEWEWVLENRASAGTSYCFRMINVDGTPFTTYTQYPQLVTNVSPTITSLDSPFDNERVASSSPWFYFVGTDAEVDSIAYQIQVDNDADFSSVIVDTSSDTNLTDFTNVNVPSDKSPFNSGDSIVYKTQATLVDGTTYWWRVRGIDPSGSNAYGAWSTEQSVTITSGTVVSTWYQTTQEQFDTNTLDETVATVTDAIVLDTGSSAGTTTSSIIDFNNGNLGNSWGEFSFTDTGATGTIVYRIEYFDGVSWELIPDLDLSGNSVGFTSSPVSLLDLDTTSYNEIRLRANFSTTSAALLDWQVTWGYRVSVVTHLSLFDNEKTGTTTPTFTFTTTDPEGQDLEYQFSWSTDRTFATGSTTVNSSTSPGFANLTLGSDTNPYNSGDTIRYAMQSALTNGTTYWWRARAKDPAGSDSYSFWSSPWSFTIDTTATTSTWFQTTEEQFETDTLLSLYASTSDSVEVNPAGVTTYTFNGITNPSITHIARDFEVDVLDPTDPPTGDEIDTLTTTGANTGVPNLRTAIAGRASDAEATNAQYTNISSSNNTRWQITDPGAGDNAIFWASFLVTEDPADIDEIAVTLEGYQNVATDKAWLGIWRPGSTTPYWQRLADSTQTGDFNFTGSITSDISQYFDGSNRIHIIFFNEDDDDSLFVDYVELEITTNATDQGTITSTPIDFDDGSGPIWGQLLWTDSEPGLSSITYQLEYLSGGDTWSVIPNSALAGNETGFTTSPVSLTGLDTTTYNDIRIVGNFDCAITTCPTLSDWTVRWSPGFTISGNAYEYDGTSSTTSGTVAVAVNGELQIGKTGSISNGSWSISNVTVFEGDVITVFVDGAANTDEAVAVTVYDGTPDIPGLRLQKRHLSIGSDDFETITNANIGMYDYTDDEDLFFDVDGGNDLTLCADATCGDASMVVLAGSTYSPGTGADLVTHDLRNNGTLISGANTFRVSGSWDNNATATLSGSTVIFTATSTSETIDSTGALSAAFNTVTLGETSGTASWTLSSTLDVDGNLNVTYGTLARGAQQLTIGGNLTTGASGLWTGIGTTTFDGTNPSTWTDQNTTRQNIGAVVVDGTAKSLFLGSSTTMQSLLVGADDTFDVTTSGFSTSVYLDWIVNGTFTARTGTVNFLATTTGRTITAGGDSFNSIRMNGVGGAWSFTESTLAVANDFMIATGTVTLPTGTTTIQGSFMNSGGTFAHNNGTVSFTGTSAETLTLGGTVFTNAFYNLRFAGSGSFSFTESNATTSNDLTITQGTVTFPSGILSVVGNFEQSGGTFNPNAGTIRFSGSSPKIIDTSSSFYNLLFTRSTSTTFVDTNVTALEDLTVLTGEVILPTGTLTIGGSLANTGTITHSSGTVLMNSSDTGETVSLGASPLYALTFNSSTGGWTISSSATTSGALTISAASIFTLGSSQTLSIGGAFTNSVGGASTTWTGSTVSLESGAYTVNTKTNAGDVYAELRVKANTDIALWNSSATLYTIDSTGSLYSQDHAGVDGDLYIFGAYERTSGTEYWSYATDFDGTPLGGGSRQVSVSFARDASALFTGSTLQILGSGTASTTIDSQSSNLYELSLTDATLHAQYYDIAHLGTRGLDLQGSTTVTSLRDGRFTLHAIGGALITLSSGTVNLNPALQVQNVAFVTESGTSSDVSTGSGDATFLFFDDFNDASIDLTKWTKDIELGAITETGGYLRAGGGITSGNYGHVSLGSEVAYDDFLDNSVVWRARNSTNGIGELVFRGDYGTNRGYKARFDQRTGTNGNGILEAPYTGWTFSGGAGCASDSLEPVADQWYRYEVTASSSNFLMYRDGSLMRNCTDTTFTLPGEIALQNHYGSYTDFDWVGVRAFVTPAPTSTSWGAEETVRSGLYREEHVVTGTVLGAQSGYVLPIVVNYGTGTDSGATMYCNGLCNADFSDIRFAKSDGEALDYWRDESFTASSTATFWVEVDTIPASPATTSIYAYYGDVMGYNVAQTDGVPSSYWWFRNSTGTIDGEAYDNDTGDPGSIRWDDSSLTITVSGTVFEDDGTTAMGAPTCGVGSPVRIVVENGASYDGACNGSGAFTIPGVVIVGDPTLTVFLNGASGGEQAVTVTKTPTADISGLNLIAGRVIVRHEDTSAMTIDDMTAYDSTDDGDIPYTAATGTLSVRPDFGLVVSANKTFTPGGSVTLMSGGSGLEYDGSLYLRTGSIFTGSGTSTYTIGGSLTQYTGASFVGASTTILMTATTTGKGIVSSSTETINLNNLTMSGVSGGWNLSGNVALTGDLSLSTGTLTGTGNVTLTNGSFGGNGTLSLGGGTTTLASTNVLGGTEPWTFANLVLGTGLSTGTTTKATTATTTVSGKLTISTGHFFAPSGSIINFTGSGTVFVENGSFVESTSTVRYGGTSGSNVLSTTYYNLLVNGSGGTPTFTGTGLGIVVQNQLTVGGTANTTFTLDTSDPALDVNGNVVIASTGTLVGSASAAFTVGGSWDSDGVYTPSGGTVLFDGTGTHTIAPGNSSFSNVTASSTGNFTFVENATTTNLFMLRAANSFTVQSGTTFAVGSAFQNGLGGSNTTWTGSTLYLYGGGNYQINGATTSDSYEQLSIGTNTQIRMWNSSAVTNALGTSASLYSQDHAGVNGDLYIYGSYTKVTGTDFWSYATDFDGSALTGSERQVDVRIQNGASVLYQGGGLAIIGGSSATTSIANQGSGTYSFRIGGSASTTMTRYDFEHMDANGLTFSGTPSVQSLAQGGFIVGVASGTAITVGGSVITQNPAKTFTGNTFGTSTSGLAFNVTATGTTASSWRFTNHSGVIAGEAYDVDPDGDPGYIVWDNSAASLTISGRVYSDEGSTVSGVCDGSINITLRVAGLTTYQTSCNGSGLYTITGVTYSPGDSFVVYIDGEVEKGATVSEDPVTNIGTLDIYENRVIVRHEGSDPLSISDMAVWDSSDDADIPFTAVDSSPDTLTLPSDRKLLVWTGKEFEPNGNITLSGGGAGAPYDGTLELLTNATFDATGSEVHTIGGSLIMGTGAVLDDETSTFTFTTSGASRTIDTNDLSFYNLTLNGSGSWTITNTVLDIGNDFTITQGALTLPQGTTTIAGSFSNTGGSFNQNGGWVVFTGTGAETIRMGGGAFGTTTFTGSGSWTYQGGHATTTGDFSILSGSVTAPTGTLTIGGDFTNSGTYTHSSGALRMISSLASTTINAGSSDLGSVVISGTGTFRFTDAIESLVGSLTLYSGTTTLPTTTISIGGSLISQGGAFIHATGTVLMNSSDGGEVITAGASTFNTLTIAAPGGGYTITGNATTTNNFSLTSATTFALQSGSTLSVNGVFTNLVGGAGTTWTGTTLRIRTGTSYAVNTKAAGGDIYNVIDLGNNTDLRLWNSAATTTLSDTVSSLYSQNNSAVNGELYIYGNYERTTGADYWSATSDFDGAVIASRAVTVRHASNATSTFFGGTLEMVGTASATTTITNQGTGTYSLQVLGGTLNAQQYAIRNIDTYGLVLGGTTTVTSLANGDFELAVSGGALMTVSSTTLNYNASAVISGVRFATSTAISGVNVPVVGTTPSAWTFTSHRGNLAGEAYDSDGIDDCGSVRWDDSTCLLTEQSSYRWRNDDGGEGVPDSEWFDLSWTKRKRVTITNADATGYTNAVVEVPIPYDSDMQVDFDDLRVTDSTGTAVLDFARETYTLSTEATLWVEIPSLPASSDTEIYVYYGNGGATYGGVGTTTFRAFDDFEDTNITEYSGETSLFSVDTTFAYQGAYGVEAFDPDDRTTDGIYRTNASSTVSQGEMIRYLEYIDTSAGSFDEACTLFGVQSVDQNDNYAICLEQVSGTDRMSISRDVDDNDLSGTILASTTVSYTTGWYEIEVMWETDDTIFASLYKDDVLVATTSATDSNYTSGGFGFTYWFQHGGWDYFTSRPILETEPTTTLGYEQVPGGATWASALNASLAGADVGTVVRPRFLIENTGLTVSDQYRLMYAPKGASPSCEAVTSGSYSAVPPQSSCGSAAICMQTSSNFTNNAGTSDLLGGDGSFTPGEIIEDPSNTTNSIGLDPDEFTEVEYAISVTGNASDPTYCLRVSDAGTAIDSYTRVAELGLVFEPSISALSLNNGIDITLTPGATTTIYATGTVSDQNGYADIVSATTTMYRSGVTDACTSDTNNCYIAGPTSCSFTNCSGDSCDIICSADFYYHADPTDIGTYAGETWRALLAIRDQAGFVATATAPSIDLVTLRALEADSLINYGTLEVSQNTGAYNATTTFTNIGNDSIDVLIEGTNLSDGLSSTIPVTEQIFATTTFTYSACTYCTQLTASSTSYELDLTKPATTTPGIADEVFWGIEIPFGVSANAHTGSNIFYATGD